MRPEFAPSLSRPYHILSGGLEVANKNTPLIRSQARLWSGLIPSTSGRQKSSTSFAVLIVTGFAHEIISLLLGNPSKAERILGWKRKIPFNELVKEMVAADLKASGSLVEDHN